MKDLIAKVKKVNNTTVKVGWFGDHKYPNGTSVAYVATIQEFGYQGGGINIPPRPFMRPAEADHKAEWNVLAAKQIDKYLHGLQSFDGMTDIIGQKIEDDIVDKIVNGDHAPLSQITLLLRKWKREGKTINRSMVEMARKELAKNPDMSVSANDTPLNDTGLMIASISNVAVTK
jgi:hypothetical protein